MRGVCERAGEWDSSQLKWVGGGGGEGQGVTHGYSLVRSFRGKRWTAVRGGWERAAKWYFSHLKWGGGGDKLSPMAVHLF